MTQAAGTRLVKPWRHPRLSVDERISALLAAITIEDEVAQLGCHWVLDDQWEVAGNDNGGDLPSRVTVRLRSETRIVGPYLRIETRVRSTHPASPTLLAPDSDYRPQPMAKINSLSARNTLRRCGIDFGDGGVPELHDWLGECRLYPVSGPRTARTVSVWCPR
jgi:hypothetical protein